MKRLTDLDNFEVSLSLNWKVARSSSGTSAILWSVTQITWTECMFWLVDSHQCTFANRSQVKFKLTNMKKLVKRLGRIETSSIYLQQFASMFADCFCPVHAHTPTWVSQHKFANFSLPCEGRFRVMSSKQMKNSFTNCLPCSLAKMAKVVSLAARPSKCYINRLEQFI